jgi:predicted nucleic acid-binding protein
MQYVDWTPQLAIDPPVYLDANVLVGTIIRTHRLYPTCVRLTATLLAGKSSVLISPVSLDECLWATAKLAYCQLTHQHPYTKGWNKKTYLKWCEKIFASYEGWITAVGSMIKDWSNAGVPIEVIPKTDALWEHVVDLTPKYMQQLKLTPADAIHLALAQTHARTFITADSDFEVLRKNPAAGELVILHLVA